jgi:hypothetical protein
LKVDFQGKNLILHSVYFWQKSLRIELIISQFVNFFAKNTRCVVSNFFLDINNVKLLIFLFEFSLNALLNDISLDQDAYDARSRCKMLDQDARC